MKNLLVFLTVAILTSCVSSTIYRYDSGSILTDSNATDSTELTLDSLTIRDIKPGYYYRRISADTTIDKIDYNKIDWIYISKDNKVKQFVTANFEYCMLEMNWKDDPKEIYHQIKKNQEKFDGLYIECEKSEYVPSEVKKNNDAIIVLHPVKGDIIASDELLFVKRGLIRKTRDYHRIISMDEYTFIGK